MKKTTTITITINHNLPEREQQGMIARIYAAAEAIAQEFTMKLVHVEKDNSTPPV